MGHVRPAAVAGSFYPRDPAVLAADLRQMLAATQTVPAELPKALIAPHAGYVYSGPIAASAYARLAPARATISRVVLIGPAHRVAFRGIAVSSASAFQTPLGAVPLDQAGIARLQAIPGVVTLDQAHALEHSLEVHLPFLQMMLDRFTLLPLVAGEAPDALVAQVLEAAWGGPETLVVVSSDLSHYEDYLSAKAHDRATATAIEHFNAGAIDHYGACGRTPLGGLLQLAKKRGMRIEQLDLRNSGDTAGPRDQVVGYGAWALYERSLSARRKLADLLLSLARQAIAKGFAKPAEQVDLPTLPEAQALGACFVTLTKDGALRGCVGSAEARRPLAEDVVDNARRAAFGDPRFPPLAREELDSVTLSLSLLSPPEPITVHGRSDLLAQLRPGIDGLIIEDGPFRALFLPAVWRQVPSKEEFLAHLLHKAGLNPHAWSPSLKAWRFTAEEFAEG
jgi:hypothetical protein